jgi:hypothetical protein
MVLMRYYERVLGVEDIREEINAKRRKNEYEDS